MSQVPNLTGFADADRFRLSIALAGSVVFHAAVIAAGPLIGQHPAQAAPAPPPLEATLQSQNLPAPVLLAPEAPSPPAAAEKKPRPAQPLRRPQRGFQVDEPAAQALRQVARNLLYPPEAIARSLEGEALVMLFLDEAGNAVAARLERTSGHAILDEAAVRAAQGVRALPDGAPREVLLPVRFRLGR